MAAALLAPAWPGPSTPAQSAALPVLKEVPPFTLTDSTGTAFHSASLKGMPWIADFIFTSCAGTCPQMSERMRALQGRLPREVRLVSISVDPDRDTPTVLTQYAARYQAQPDRWIFLTGQKGAIQSLVQEGFRLSVAEGLDPGEPIAHSVRFVLVDGAGRIRGYYDSTEPKALKQLVRDALQLASHP